MFPATACPHCRAVSAPLFTVHVLKKRKKKAWLIYHVGCMEKENSTEKKNWELDFYFFVESCKAHCLPCPFQLLEVTRTDVRQTVCAR